MPAHLFKQKYLTTSEVPYLRITKPFLKFFFFSSKQYVYLAAKHKICLNSSTSCKPALPDCLNLYGSRQRATRDGFCLSPGPFHTFDWELSEWGRRQGAGCILPVRLALLQTAGAVGLGMAAPGRGRGRGSLRGCFCSRALGTTAEAQPRVSLFRPPMILGAIAIP